MLFMKSNQVELKVKAIKFDNGGVMSLVAT